ncbi:MAG: hypothetical protein EOM03_17400 [Clostridia bacterium]|nr:hypothetical protein [Clostridia bacterium]
MKTIDTFVPALVVEEVNGVTLYANKRGQFFVQSYIEDGDFWKVQEVTREDALRWCEVNGLPGCDYRPVFGLWDEE